MTRNEHDMSREEAIDLLDNLIGMVEDNHESDYDTALKMGIKSLSQEPTNVIATGDGAYYKIKALQEPCTHPNKCHECEKILTCTYYKQEPCEDAISRQAVIDKIKEVCFSKEQEWVEFRVSQGSNGQRDFLINYIKKLPSVKPPQEPKTGHWIADVDKWGDVVTTVNGYRCDKCNAFNSDKDNYCHNCGARMVEPQESEVNNGQTNK